MDKNINDYKLIIIDDEGELFKYDKTFVRHQYFIDSFTKIKNYDSSNPDYLLIKGNILIYNLNNGLYFISLPKEITDMQLYSLEYLNDYFDDILNLYVESIDGKSFKFKENIAVNFSEQVIQSFFQKQK